MERSDYKSFYISEDGTIIRENSSTILKDKIEKMKKRVGGSVQGNHTDSPFSLLEKAREVIDISGREDEAMTIFYRLDVQPLMTADDCFRAGIYMFEVKNNKRDAMNWYDMAVKKGGIEAKFRLAWLYRNGYGLPQDDVKARDIFFECAACGYAKAEEEMGNIYFSGALGVSINYEAAENMFISSEMHGNEFIKYGSYFKEVKKMKLLKQLSKKAFAMQIDNVTTSSRGVRVTGKVSEGIVNIGDCVSIVGKLKVKEAVVTEREIFDRTYKEAHGDYAFPGDRVHLLLRGVDSKDVNIGDWLKSRN